MPLNPQSMVPTIGQSVTCHDGPTGIIKNLIRNNSYGKWSCAIFRASDGSTKNFDVFFDAGVWKTADYIETIYPDKDGVEKNL